VAERIRVTFDSDLRRSRLAALFRLPLAIVPALSLAFWTVAALVLLVASWAITAVRGSVPPELQRLQLRYLQSLVRFAAWFGLVSAPRNVSVHVDRATQRRVRVVLRPLLALPAIVLASVLAVALAWTTVGAWFAALAFGRTTHGLQELGAFCIRYEAETLAYLMLLTPCYPAVAPQTPQ
jgi:hypothetical protein